jgi:hypothetical protein
MTAPLMRQRSDTACIPSLEGRLYVAWTTHPADWDPPMPTEAELLAALAESEAEAEAGLFVYGEEIMRELRESIARMEGQAKAAASANIEPGSSPRR